MECLAAARRLIVPLLGRPPRSCVMGMRADFPAYGVTPQSFVSEVLAFRQLATNPAFTADDKRRAYGLIVHHATMLNPLDAGYEGAGVALKLALCSWLDSQPH